jgi:K+-sensing histidine kinase KdpD
VLPVVVYADEKRLRQILLNLLSNAIKFTQSARCNSRSCITYRSPVAVFEVIDTGLGHSSGRPRADLRAVRARLDARRHPATDRAPGSG